MNESPRLTASAVTTPEKIARTSSVACTGDVPVAALPLLVSVAVAEKFSVTGPVVVPAVYKAVEAGDEVAPGAKGRAAGVAKVPELPLPLAIEAPSSG